MSTAAASQCGWLAHFCRRLRGGIDGSLASTRPGDHGLRDTTELGEWLTDAWVTENLSVLPGIHGRNWDPDKELPAMLDRLTRELAGTPRRLAGVIFSPHRLLGRLLQLVGPSEQDSERDRERHEADCWLAMCWLAEAAWAAITGTLPASAGFTAGDPAALRPVAARMRFLVLSEPMRWRARQQGPWHADLALSRNGVIGRAFGPDSWPELVDRCREARHEWQDCLSAYQAHPLLRRADPRELEQEIRWLVCCGLGRRDAPLRISARFPLSEPAGLTADDTAVIADTVERHLLPRFAITAAARLMLYDDDPRRMLSRRLLGAAAAVCALGAVGLAADLRVHLAVRLAAACYALICLGVLVLPAGWGAIWLLRMPAASAVGIIALVGFLPGGWLRSPPGGWAAAAALLAVAFGYLLIEVRNHGAARGTAVPRAALVAAIGAVHAIMISVIGLTVVAPAFVQDGARLNQIWSKPGYEHAGMVLALAAAWCLAIGVFSQILWDDRPITAPLAHLSWRG